MSIEPDKNRLPPEDDGEAYLERHLPADAQARPVRSSVGRFFVAEYPRADGTIARITRIDYGTTDSESQCEIRQSLRRAIDLDDADHRCQVRRTA